MSSTRLGDLDPDVALYLIEQHGCTTERLRGLLKHASGLASVEAGRRDMRDLAELAPEDSATMSRNNFSTRAGRCAWAGSGDETFDHFLGAGRTLVASR